MSNQPMTSANFYEGDSVTYEFVDDNTDVVRITTTSEDIRQLFLRDFSPMCFIVCYENDQENPSMTAEELHDIHYKAKKGLNYNPNHILNHQWIDKIKQMTNWQPGKEVGFQALLDDDNNIVIALYDDIVSCHTKIDEDGFLCHTMKIPTSRSHLHDTIFHTSPPIFTEYQRVVCWYNSNLEEQSRP